MDKGTFYLLFKIKLVLTFLVPIILHFYKDISLLDKSFVTVEAGIVSLYFLFKALLKWRHFKI